MDFSEEDCHSESESSSQFSDDSQNDPNFDVEETRLTLSNLSLKRKTKRSTISGVKEMESEEDGDEKDKKIYEIIQKMIEGGQVDRLKVEECKIYLRQHGLRLSGKKEILIQRIKDHVDIVNGGWEAKYPASSFVLNCKGDACKGDVVIFEQNVYEEFSIVSRSANGGPCGMRIVAGKILKESYGAAKQQHTFTIEVLWSKGEKPLPPLHPLLIKGRNLYRLKTMRQKWEDEGERQRILLEKHARGGAARSNREARIQQKEKRKMQRSTRTTRNEHPNGKQEQERRRPLRSIYVNPDELIRHSQEQQHGANSFPRTQELNNPIQPVNLCYMQNIPAAPTLHQRKLPILHEEGHPNFPPLFSSNHNHPEIPVQRHTIKENLGYPQQKANAVGNRPILQQKKQICPYFGQGRCYFGDRCKFLHEMNSN